MADENEFGGVAEVSEEELGEGMHPVDVDAVIDDVDDADTPLDDNDPLIPKPLISDEEEESAKSEEEGLDPEEEAYFYGDRYEDSGM